MLATSRSQPVRRPVAPASVPSGLRRDLELFEWDYPTVKVNIARRSRSLARSSGTLGRGGAPRRRRRRTGPHRCRPGHRAIATAPFLLVGQTPRRLITLPAGTEALGLSTYRGVADDARRGPRRPDRPKLERHAPGFLSLVLDREVHVRRPLRRECLPEPRRSRGGTSQLHQQLIFRPTIGLGSPRNSGRRPLPGQLGDPPGPGVHGACGWLAARAALRDAAPSEP